MGLAVRNGLGLTVLLAVLFPGWARAQAPRDEERTTFEAGFRAGVGFPLGNLSSGKKLTDWVTLALPLTFELGARIFGKYEIAAMGQYAIGAVDSTTGSGCYTGNNACSASIGQIGVEFLYHPLGLAAVDPFIGVGVGYEWLVVRATVEGRNYDQALGGFNWAILQGGVDLSLGKGFRVGPYGLVSLGQYQSSNFTVPTPSGPQSGSTSIANPAVHLWLSVGLRLLFAP
jgi:hypothetical protein